MNLIKKVIKNPSYVWDYIVGNYRYRLFYSRNNFIKNLMRLHIRKQISFRIATMNRECYEQGQCIKCGCQTTHLQMCSRICEGNCYPKLYNNYFNYLKFYKK